MKKIIIGGIEDVPPLSISLQPTLWNKTGAWRYLRPIYSREKVSNCMKKCPIEQNIPRWMGKVKEENFEEAGKIILEDNPFPGICGRVCHHPCEDGCIRKGFDEAVSINAVERFLGDYLNEVSINRVAQTKKIEKKIGIVGSGPAGLSCAYHLSRKGYNVEVFEALSEFGGMLNVIPTYRLPKKVLHTEISNIQEMGVKLSNKIKIDYDTLNNDMSEFNAIFIATGATIEHRLNIPGNDLEGVFFGVEFLRIANKKKLDIGDKVVIIGGGNTAIDVARTVWRMGKKPLILYRRTREEMPAIKSEIDEALKEGVKIEYLCSPTRIKGKDGKVNEIECIRNELNSSINGLRPIPVPIKGTKFTISANFIVLALGSHPDNLISDLQLSMNGNHIVTDYFGKTNHELIFAGGDVATGSGTVSDAIGSGKRAAVAIDNLITKKESFHTQNKKNSIVELNDINLSFFMNSKRTAFPKISVKGRSKRFHEVNKPISNYKAVREANRCFECGSCNNCGICINVCPDVAIQIEEESLTINYDYCKGCGICAIECPRSVIILEREEIWRK